MREVLGHIDSVSVRDTHLPAGILQHLGSCLASSSPLFPVLLLGMLLQLYNEGKFRVEGVEGIPHGKSRGGKVGERRKERKASPIRCMCDTHGKVGERMK